MKTVGIIGGLGPETTSEFYLRIISLCHQKNKIARPPILMWSIPLSYQVEEDLITKAIGEERYIPYLVEAAQRLESGGADFIVIPCNSVHVFINEVRAAVTIPVLSIVEESVTALKSKDITQVGLLATKTTIQRNLYGEKLAANGIVVAHINDLQQEKIGEIINRLVLKQENETDRTELIDMINNFVSQGVTNILLACTDLQLLVPQVEGVQVLDTMEILAEVTANKILSE